MIEEKNLYKIYEKTTRASISFIWTIRQLEDCEGLTEIYNRKSIPRYSNFQFHTYEPLIYLKTIKLELILKQLYFLKSNIWIKNHKSIDIFDKLDDEDKKFIKTEYNIFKKEIKLNNSGFIILEFRNFIEINEKFIRDLKYGDGLYMKQFLLYPSHKFYGNIIDYIILKHKEHKKTIEN